MKQISIITFALCALALGCNKESQTDPSIETLSASPTSGSTFLVTGNVKEIGSFPIVDYGFAYSQNSYVDTSSYKISFGKAPTKGTFQKEISPFVYPYGYQTYNWSVRAYLTNKKGTVYGKILSVNFPVIMISSVSPLAGKVGDHITITGSNFSTTPSSNVVMFNNVQANVISATASQLVVTVPSGISNYYYNGITILIKTVGGDVTATQYFNLLPNVTGFSPQNGTFGTLVTINGSDFNNSGYYYSYSINVGGINTSMQSVSSTSISFYIPSGVTTESLKFSLNAGNYYGGATSVDVPGTFTINKPAITSMSPTTGVGGSLVTINGQNFNSNYSQVTVGGVNAPVQSSTSSQITFSVPTSLSLGAYDVSVFTGVHTVAAANKFTLASPQITDFQPQSGIRGTYVTITGSNFGSYNYYNGTSVLFGNTQVSIYSWTETSITVYLPTYMPTGSMTITLNTGGQSVTSVNSFTVNP